VAAVGKGRTLWTYRDLPIDVWAMLDTSNSDDAKTYLWIDPTREAALNRYAVHQNTPSFSALNVPFLVRRARLSLKGFVRVSDVGSPHPSAPYGYYCKYN
jgi:hypothetical protein